MTTTNLLESIRQVGYMEGRTSLRSEVLAAVKDFGSIPDSTDAQCREMMFAVMTALVESFAKDDKGAEA